MLNAISGLLALIVGITTWAAAIGLRQGLGVVGRTGWLEVVCFILPIAIIVAPRALRLFENGSPVSAIWLIAAGPFIGVVNVLLVGFLGFFLSKLFGTDLEIIALLVTTVIWSVPVIGSSKQDRVGEPKRHAEKPWGIYDADGQLLTFNESKVVIASFDRQQCDSFLRSFGRNPSSDSESLVHARMRCLEALNHYSGNPPRRTDVND